ncbi:undecaprenyl/decaprenyl-phosphate alpha-N-acetylglucosaminyl 1-phosphate transferase [Flavobacteriales bacterium]|nr:undecaprenyl/decaprenyl-phosphate alpha-N-acetylglucosaminyl 1-phosphate transferase [Flavobacteriales bacterium]
MLATVPIEQPTLLFSIYLAFFLGSILFSFLLNKVLLKFSSNLGIRNHDVSIVRWSSTSKPALGGISFFIAFLISGSFYNLLFDLEVDVFNKELLGIVSASSLAFIMGLSDDAYNTKPLLKFGTQILCGVILVYTGTYISIFPNEMANYCLTVFWVVGMMNSINMLDNMDGITTTVSIFTILASILTIYLYNDYSSIHLLILLGVLGSLIGFLFFNWHPSKMFMGDTGSQFLGVFLSAIGIIYFWNNKGIGGEAAHTRQIIITLLAFIIPIIDTTTVTINRLRKGIPPYIGGKDHTTHHLSYLGYSDTQIGLIYGGLSFGSVLLILVIIKGIQDWNYWHASLFLTYFLLVFSILYRNTIVTKQPDDTGKSTA